MNADSSLAQSGRKQARKHVRNARDFNNIEKRVVARFFSARQITGGNSRHSDKKKLAYFFLAGLRTYQHPCRIYYSGF